MLSSNTMAFRVVGMLKLVLVMPNTAINRHQAASESRFVKNARGQVGPKKAEGMSVHSLTRLGLT